MKTIEDRISALLNTLYDPQDADRAMEGIRQTIRREQRASEQDAPKQAQHDTQGTRQWVTQQDIILITYGDTLNQPNVPPLQTLHRFAAQYLKEAVSGIHILPFYPYSSDDGFSVKDFYAVNPALGRWEHVQALSDDFDLMFDAVFNHMSAQGQWFHRWLAGDPEYAGLIMTENPQTDLSAVTRPRATALLTPFQRPDGETVHVWTTFSADQVDFDFRSPSTLLRLIDVLLFYVRQGARFIRLDAIPFLWKVPGTTSVHLPQTHAVIQLMRAVLDAVAPHAVLITEANVPHAENVAYFGDGRHEAQMVYNFTLPPLLLHAMLTGETARLRDWINTLNTPSDRTTFFNFTASHDGIGVRPVEGILDTAEIQGLIQHIEAVGGRVSSRRRTDGTESPYELNCTYFDAMGTPERFLTSQTIALSLAGVPGIYIHSLLGTRNDLDGMARTGHNRSINRAHLVLDEVEQAIRDETTERGRVFGEYLRRIKIRRAQAAFHPNGPQETFQADTPGVLLLRRLAPDRSQAVLCVYNLTDQPVTLDLSAHLHGEVVDLLSGQTIKPTATLPPLGCLWLDVPPA